MNCVSIQNWKKREYVFSWNLHFSSIFYIENPIPLEYSKRIIEYTDPWQVMVVVVSDKDYFKLVRLVEAQSIVNE